MKVFTAPALAAALYATQSSADPVSYCADDNDEVCFQIAVPESSASSGSGNIFFQITAPDTYRWIALGTGQGMAGSNVFLVYQDGQGNVTLSPRLATEFAQPEVVSRSDGGADLELLAGTGVDDDQGTMTANVRCSNCDSWNGGSMDFGSDDTGWIAAWLGGDPVDSTSVSYSIEKHDEARSFTIDLTQAVVSEDENPFPGTAIGSGDSDAVGGGDDDGGAGSAVLLAHGVIMTVVFIVLYPLGAMLMPLLGQWFIHAGWQVVAFLAMWAAFGLGYIYARDNGYLFNNAHTVLGTVVVSLMGIQPALGFWHHLHFKRHQRRGIVSYGHIWVGRIVLVLGIINGGLGLELASSSSAWIIAYGVIAGVMAVLYGLALVFRGWRTRSRAAKESRGSRGS